MQELFNFNGNICLSGGAKGADAFWGIHAANNGFDVIHWSFARHKHHVPQNLVRILDQNLLEDADPYLMIANKTLRRKWPVSSINTANLLRRNYYQVAWSDSIYAISHFDEFGQVSGGTAWAVQMFIDLHPGKPAYMFDQIVKDWYQWKGNIWQRVGEVPRPEGVFAGVGKRDLLPSGELAIQSVF